MALPDCREVWVGGGRPVPERSNRSSDGTTVKYTAVREDQRPDLKKKWFLFSAGSCYKTGLMVV